MSDGLKRGRDGTDDDAFESDDDAPLMLIALSVPTIEQLLQAAEWMQPWTPTEKVLAGVNALCSSQGFQCTARVRSSDKTRVTIACKHQATHGCPLRLTAKKPEGYTKTIHPNIHSFVLGTCGSTGTTSVPPPPPVPTPPTVVTVSDPPKPSALSTTPTIPVPSPAKCIECPDVPESLAVISCASIEHHWCSDCVNNLAVSQLGDRDLFLSRRCKFVCPYDGTDIDWQRVLSTVTADTFSAAVEALTEQAVVDTEKRMESRAKVTCNLHTVVHWYTSFYILFCRHLVYQPALHMNAQCYAFATLQFHGALHVKLSFPTLRDVLL